MTDLLDLLHEDLYSMKSRTILDGSKAINIFNEAHELIATVYADADSEKQELIARAIVNIPAILKAMKQLCSGQISGAEIHVWEAYDAIRELLKRIDGEEAQS